MTSGVVVELFIGSVLGTVSVILLAASKVTYKMIDATAGSTAEKWARAGFTLGAEWYPWQRPRLRWGFPLTLLVTGLVFIIDALT